MSAFNKLRWADASFSAQRIHAPSHISERELRQAFCKAVADGLRNPAESNLSIAGNYSEQLGQLSLPDERSWMIPRRGGREACEELFCLAGLPAGCGFRPWARCVPLIRISISSVISWAFNRISTATRWWADTCVVSAVTEHFSKCGNQGKRHFDGANRAASFRPSISRPLSLGPSIDRAVSSPHLF